MHGTQLCRLQIEDQKKRVVHSKKWGICHLWISGDTRLFFITLTFENAPSISGSAVSALQRLHLPHSLSDAKAGQLLANWPSWIQRFVGISVGLFLFWVSVSALPHTWGSSIKTCAIQISHSRNVAGTWRSAKGSPGVDLFWWDRRPGPWLLMTAKKSHEVVYKRGRTSPGVQIKRVKSRSPSEMHIRILIVTHLQVMLGEAAARQTPPVATLALPWDCPESPYGPAAALQTNLLPREEINRY